MNRIVPSQAPGFLILVAATLIGSFLSSVQTNAQDILAQTDPLTAPPLTAPATFVVSQPENTRELAERLKEEIAPSLIRVYWKGEKRNEADLTSGFPVSQGTFVSVRPTASVSEEVVIRTENYDYEGNVTLVDPTSGLVLIKTSLTEAVPPVPTLRMGSSRTRLIGDVLFTVSINEEGELIDCLAGMLIGRDRQLEGSRLPVAYLRPQVPDAISARGLPILDQHGNVIAIDLGIQLDDDGQEFHALPVEVAAKLVTDLEFFGKREDAWLGITFNTGTTTPKVVTVREDSPGHAAGIQPGDVVISLAGNRIDTLDDLADTCYCLTPGREAEVQILRGVTSMTKTLRPASITAKPRDRDGAVMP